MHETVVAQKNQIQQTAETDYIISHIKYNRLKAE